MSAGALDKALEQLRVKARADQAIAAAVKFLAGEGVDEPWDRPDRAVLQAARSLNRERQGQHRDDLLRRTIDTADVVALIPSISDRRGVDRRRSRGALLGVKVGRRTLHPEWQFDRRRGETRRGLALLLAALREVAQDPAAADALMMSPRPELDGRSIADVFADGQAELAARLVRMAGDQS